MKQIATTRRLPFENFGPLRHSSALHDPESKRERWWRRGWSQGIFSELPSRFQDFRKGSIRLVGRFPSEHGAFPTT